MEERVAESCLAVRRLGVQVRRMNKSSIERVRSFNRLVSQSIGALNDSYLGRGRPLGQARVVFETGPEGCDLAGLRERLGLDSGYMSRLLRALAAEELISVEDDDADRRRRILRLTEKGIAEHAAYDRLSELLDRLQKMP